MGHSKEYVNNMAIGAIQAVDMADGLALSTSIMAGAGMAAGALCENFTSASQLAALSVGSAGIVFLTAVSKLRNYDNSLVHASKCSEACKKIGAGLILSFAVVSGGGAAYLLKKYLPHENIAPNIHTQGYSC